MARFKVAIGIPAFQFQEGAIKSTPLAPVSPIIPWFQFQEGAIKRLKPNAAQSNEGKFQFQEGAIIPFPSMKWYALNFYEFI